jgi:hypothetical protein
MNILNWNKNFNRLREAVSTQAPVELWRTVVQKATWQGVSIALLATVSTVASMDAAAVPLFARQTGQNCQACHAGGQFPELTPYGRMFKLTGYTLGQRTSMPVALMAVFTSTSAPMNSSPNVPGSPQVGGTGTGANGTPTFATASLFAGGKLTDSIGMLAQYSFDNYSGDTGQEGRIFSDNTDIRYAKHIINNQTDLIFGFDANNNPGVEDVWNSSGAWGYNVVPGSEGVGPSALQPLLMSTGLGQQAVGAGAYMYWNKTLYAELSGYRTGDGVFSFLTHNYGQTYIQGTNPYVRLALTHDWGTSNAMVGYTYFDANVYEGAVGSSLVDEHRDNMVDFQYQYLLDPSVVTVEMADVNEQIFYGGGGATDSINTFRAKASYTYKAHYGASLSYFNASNTANNTSFQGCADGPAGNVGQCGAEGWTPEVYFMPVQNVRVGLQYTMFNTVNGTTLNASQNNTTMLYAWTAF